MICNKCGNQIDENAKYCGNCGLVISEQRNIDIEQIKKSSYISIVLSIIAIAIAGTWFLILAGLPSNRLLALIVLNLICIVMSVKALSIALKNRKQIKNVLTAITMIAGIFAFFCTVIFTLRIIGLLVFGNVIEMIFKAGASG